MWQALFENPRRRARISREQLGDAIYAVHAQLEGLSKADAIFVLQYCMKVVIAPILKAKVKEPRETMKSMRLEDHIQAVLAQLEDLPQAQRAHVISYVLQDLRER